MEQENSNTQQVNAVKIKQLVDNLVATASIIKDNIEKNDDRSVWPYKSSIIDRASQICQIVLGEKSNEITSSLDRLSAVYSIDRDIVLSGWSDDITAKLADTLTFVKDDFDKNEEISSYFLDLCSFVAHSLEMKNYLNNVEEEDIKQLSNDMQVVYDLLDELNKLDVE